MSIKVKETAVELTMVKLMIMKARDNGCILNDLVDFKELKDKTKNKDIIFIGDHTPNFKN